MICYGKLLRAYLIFDFNSMVFGVRSRINFPMENNSPFCGKIFQLALERQIRYFQIAEVYLNCWWRFPMRGVFLKILVRL